MSTDSDAYTAEFRATANVRLAHCIREVERIREASWITAGQASTWGEYTKTYSACIAEVVGDDPIGTILGCLFTAGFCDMYDFADRVLGKESA